MIGPRVVPYSDATGRWCPQGLEVHPERAALLSELQQAPGLTWTPGIVERFAAEKPGSSRIYGVKGNVSEAKGTGLRGRRLEVEMRPLRWDVHDFLAQLIPWTEAPALVRVSFSFYGTPGHPIRHSAW